MTDGYRIVIKKKDIEVKNASRRREIFLKLTDEQNPEVFQPRKVVFDGKKGMFSSELLNLGDSDKLEVRFFFVAIKLSFLLVLH